MSQVVRAIEAFDPVTERLYGKWEFSECLIESLRPLFDIEDDRDMIFGYAISDDIKGEVSRITGISLSGPYLYFIDSWVRE